ncbi:DNA internalization-related competence protein ComEC/Rec2 [Pseudomethylobacillus aquaticus]|uniref:DNA internalization-related competence protein ComEC/Rec2 n=1 Tax=Pseudomethylobacillus aquaticus TaxID=2676064 RepID=A0A3N0V3X1_9PROT|nr:DNA internalization-related competence protein ComEC/Rec2 [Pseudomethylobacillus aquaticus]ROH87284.1 DNA internalization-related competence protein ComEC/Rec2 [Pseudomethylobacillus aquaticus]
MQLIPGALMFVCGVWGLQQQAELPGLPSLAFAVGLGLLLLLVLTRRAAASRPVSDRWFSFVYPSFFIKALCLLLAFLAGFSWAAIAAHSRLSDRLESAWEGRDISLIGVVASLPQSHARGQRFVFDVEQVLTPGAHLPGRVLLSNYQVSRSSASPQVMQAAQRWQLTVRLKQAHGNYNPHGFDYEAWLLQQNLRATGYVRHQPAPQLLESRVWQPAYLLQAVREQLRQSMQQVLAGRAYAGVLQALVIGDQGVIPAEQWQLFLHTGTNHLMSISGLHITMLSGLVFALCYAGWRRSPRLCLHLPALKAATLAGALAALAYTLIAGFSIPSQRTLYMLLVFAAALWLGRGLGLSAVLTLALLVVVLIDPWAVLAPGFWLSFGAVAVIGYALHGRLRSAHWLKQSLWSQWAVTLGLLPMLLLMFNQLSVVAPLANLFAIPLISLVVVPLALLGAFLQLDWPLLLAHALLDWGMQLLEVLASLPVSLWAQAAPPLWSVPLALLGMGCLLLPRGVPLRWLGLVLCLPLFLSAPPRPANGAMQVVMLDVGQGTAVLVRTAGHALLYDTGPRFSEEADAASRVILPYLRGEGVQHLDGLVVSHDDSDHSGGMQTLLESLPVSRVWSSLAVVPRGVRHQPCRAGQVWNWDGVRFEMLHPARSVEAATKDNDRSCVLRVSHVAGRLLLAGDIERRAEMQLLEQDASLLAADVLLVPHHGSGTSSTTAFIEAVNPAFALVSAGYRNRFGHPKPDIVARYVHAGRHVYRTDQHGAVLVDFDADGIRLSGWRQQRPRYWHASAVIAQ